MRAFYHICAICQQTRLALIMKNILVTGGTGYIGSHTVVELLANGFDVTILDNLSNSSRKVLPRINAISGQTPHFIEGDIRQSDLLSRLMGEREIDAVIHFAGLKAVGESVSHPLKYYQNNVEGSLTLFQAMAEHQCFNLVFSSSATVYGDPSTVPISESASRSATNPYGHSKLMIEDILFDLQRAETRWSTALLRYFNPVAAHPSGLIGEDPSGIPNNLLPYVAQVAVGKRERLTIHGNDYPTPDGTGVRDYIHVVDLAKAHIAALQNLAPSAGCHAYNIGTGKGYSVLEVVQAFEHASGRDIDYQIGERRAGDIASCYADPSFARESLGWEAKADLATMMADHWRWQEKNPAGYN